MAEAWKLLVISSRKTGTNMLEDNRKAVKSLAVISAMLGVWLLVSSLAFSVTDILAINGAVAGALIAALATIRAAGRDTSLVSWVDATLGGWVVLSPWVLGGLSRDFRTWNYFIVGVLVTGVAVLSLTSSGVRPRSGTKKAAR